MGRDAQIFDKMLVSHVPVPFDAVKPRGEQAAERRCGARSPAAAAAEPRGTAAAGHRLRPAGRGGQRRPRLTIQSWKQKRDSQFIRAVGVWRGILERAGGRTWRLLQKLGPARADRHLQAMLRRWSHRTVLGHADNVMRFTCWRRERHGELALDAAPGEDEAVSVLIDYVHELIDSGVAPTAPQTKLRSLAFFARLAGAEAWLPAKNIAVATPAAAYRRENAVPRRPALPYTVEQVRAIEAAATTQPCALVRVTLRNELRKIYGILRNDDAVWDRPATWRSAGGPQGFLYGAAYKTKGTEATSTRVTTTMPWAAPLRGVCEHPSNWAAGYTQDLNEVGVLDADYAVPSPWAARARLRPPGAAEPDEWMTQIRHSLRCAGLARAQSARITLHSAKHTGLTWAGASGKFEKMELEILGHHRSAGNGQTVRGYNATELSGPVLKFSNLLQSIAEGAYAPDNPPGLQWSGPGAGSPTPAAPSEANASRVAEPAPRREPERAPELSAADQSADSGPFGYIVPVDQRTSTRREGRAPVHVHLALPVGQARDNPKRRTAKAVVQTPQGDCTNMCDFSITQAEWTSTPEFSANRVACAVCWARATRACAAGPEPMAAGHGGAGTHEGNSESTGGTASGAHLAPAEPLDRASTAPAPAPHRKAARRGAAI